MRILIPNRRRQSVDSRNRKGAVLVLAAALMLIVIGFAAFTVDLGMVTLTKGQMQSAADSAAHAATLEIARSFGPGNELSTVVAEELARARAVEMVGRFRTGNLASTASDEVRDVRLGRRSWNSVTESWDEVWGVSPYNMVEVTVRRTSAVESPLPMTFAQVLGRDEFDLETVGVAALAPGVGFQLPVGSPDTIAALPIALDLGSWNALLAQIYDNEDNGYPDDYKWDYAAGEVDDASDNIPEINIYPDLNSGLAPGNRGTVDLGSPNNSTNDLKRQILYGLNDEDLSYFPDNKITFDENGALYLNGDTGISAGIENALESIIGRVSAIPIFIEVTGQGNNTTYTIVKFVGVRVMGVKLSGGPNKRHLTVQPALFSSSHVIRGNVEVNVDSILSQPVIIH